MIKQAFFDIGDTLLSADNFLSNIAEKVEPKLKHKIALFLQHYFIDYFQDVEQKEFIEVKEILSRALKEVAKKFKVKDISENAGELYFNHFLDNCSLCEGAIEILHYFKQRGIILIALSDSDANVMIAEMEKLKIKELFDHIIISSEVKAYKPSEKMVKEAKKLLYVSGEEAILVGDLDVDIVTAKKMLIKSFLVDKKKNITETPDIKINSLFDLKHFVN